MKNKGFTLMELLGVIVILAVLMIIVFPNITNSVKNSSDKTDDLTRKLIYNASDLFISNHSNLFNKLDGMKYEIELKDLVDEGLLVAPIKYSDEDDITNNKCIEVTYNKGYKYELKEKGTCEKVICRVITTETEGKYTRGDEYLCKVDPNIQAYSFYILSNPSENSTTLDLIMNSNFSGKSVSWNTNNINTLGPVNALTNLKELTKSWTNLKSLKLNTFNDSEGNTKPMQEFDMYARLPYKSEIDDSQFLYNNIFTDYWTSTLDYNTTNVYYVNKDGLATGSPDQLKGIRPVITVSKDLIYNKTKLDIKNNLPDEYQEVEYIGGTGTQYINTDLILSNNTNIRCRFKTQNNVGAGSGYVFGTDGKVTDGRINVSTNNATRKTVVFGTKSFIDFDYKTNTDYEIEVNKNVVSINGTEVVNGSTEIFKTSPLRILAMNTYVGQFLIRELKVFENDVQVRNFIPCYRKLDNVIGLYDTVNNVFYTNEGTGTFLKGNDVF